jgi:hypothetical protein
MPPTETRDVAERLRTFLLYTSAALCGGTVVELLLAKHTQDAVQLIPFALCGIGLAVVVAAILRPRRETLLALRLVMVVLVLGSLFGVYEHLASNVSFELEMRPGATLAAVWLKALQGAAPLLAPGILALAGMLAIAGTYEHPALRRGADARGPAVSRGRAG